MFGYSDQRCALPVVSYILFLTLAAIAYFRTLAGKPILPLQRVMV
jgi:hypothetical protein